MLIRVLSPRMSLRRMNSWRVEVQVCPVRVRKLSPVCHSSVVRLVSRANECRCVISEVRRALRRGLGEVELSWMACGVMVEEVRSVIYIT